MKKVVETNPELAGAIWQLLPDIDDDLNLIGCPLWKRTMDATNILLSDFLTVEPKSDKPPFEQKWFAIIFAIVADWFETRYGQALKDKQGELLGIVEIHSLPFKVGITPNYRQAHPSGEQSTLFFGPKLGEFECPRDWISAPPALLNLTASESLRLDHDLRSLTAQLRSINLYLKMGYPAPDRYVQHRNATLLSVRKAAEHIARRTEEDYASAAWEIHFAIENVIKTLISQTGAVPVQEHKLTELIRQVKSLNIPLDIEGKTGFLPSANRAIQSRYGHPFPGGYRAVITLYKKSLPLIVEISSHVKRAHIGDDAAITMRKPPWFEFME